MDRYSLIENIIMYLKGSTGINFQLKLGKTLKIYYNYMGKKYEMPSHYGGDKKNDGWVVDDGIFYQIFAPTQIKGSLRKDIETKFKSDLEGLLRNIYEEGLWGGNITKFIFIVNTIDGNLPQDSGRFFEKTVMELQEKCNVSFFYAIDNCGYIEQLLYGVENIETLKEMASSLHILNSVNVESVTERMIIDLIANISCKCSDKLVGCKYDNYDRISPLKKIKVNNLLQKQEYIERMMPNLDVVESAIKEINQDILCEGEFEVVKSFIIDQYKSLSMEHSGVMLYEKLIEEIIITLEGTVRWSVNSSVELLVCYIFDKCDIFERE